MLFLSLTLPMAAGEEGRVGSWEQSQSMFMASVKMACQISAATKSFTADETFARFFKKKKSASRLLSYTHFSDVFCLAAYISDKTTDKRMKGRV